MATEHAPVATAFERRRDIIVIGCSAGGVDALPRLLQQLPVRLPAAVFVVMHMAANRDPYLVEILRRASVLPVTWAEQGEAFETGHVYVAPPDVHLLFNDGNLQLARTARENHSRPSIDKLFRSAASAHGSRVIGVLLTGMLDDGVAGLATIREAGGMVIVQDPADAQFPDLPANALAALPADHVLPVEQLGGSLAKLAGTAVGHAPVPRLVAVEANYDRTGAVTPADMQQLGPQTPFGCPDCGGPLWQVGSEYARRFRCYNGHAMSARQLIVESEVKVEGALWSAVRALNDRAGTLETLAADAEKLGHQQTAQAYAGRARQTREQAELARVFLVQLQASGVTGSRGDPSDTDR